MFRRGGLAKAPPGEDTTFLMSDLAKKLAGKFLVIDGPDGAGKTTQLSKLRDYLAALGTDVDVAIDPGTTRIGTKIRHLLLNRDNGEISPMCETLLFMASRAQLVDELIRPATEAGRTVLCDRFISATLAYQGASGVDWKTIIDLGEIAIGGRWPDLTVILDIPVDEGNKRIGVDRERLKRPDDEELQKLGAASKRTSKRPGPDPRQMFLFGDRLEARSASYHERVRRIFSDLKGKYPGRVCYVDGTGTPDEVFSRLIEAVTKGLVDSIE